MRQDFEEAIPLLDQAIASLPCLDSNVERSLGAQLHFLRGFAAFALNDKAGARAQFLRVLDYDPTFAYPSRLSDEARPLLDEIRRSATTAWSS